MTFVDPDLYATLDALSADAADSLPFGLVKLDDAGVVQLYNKWEAEMAGLEPSSALGRNFFEEVAPCTNNRFFVGRFRSGVARGNLDETFEYTFTYRMRPTPVRIAMYRHPALRSNWLFVQKR